MCKIKCYLKNPTVVELKKLQIKPFFSNLDFTIYMYILYMYKMCFIHINKHLCKKSNLDYSGR